MELRGYRRANKPQSGLFSRHYFHGRVVSGAMQKGKRSSDRPLAAWSSRASALPVEACRNRHHLTIMRTGHCSNGGMWVRRRGNSGGTASPCTTYRHIPRKLHRRSPFRGPRPAIEGFPFTRIAEIHRRKASGNLPPEQIACTPCGQRPPSRRTVCRRLSKGCLLKGSLKALRRRGSREICGESSRGKSIRKRDIGRQIPPSAVKAKARRRFPPLPG